MRRSLCSLLLVCLLSGSALGGGTHEGGDQSCPPDETCPQSAPADPSDGSVISVVVDGVLFIFSLV